MVRGEMEFDLITLMGHTNVPGCRNPTPGPVSARLRMELRRSHLVGIGCKESRQIKLISAHEMQE